MGQTFTYSRVPCMIFSTHKEVDKLNFTKLATDFVLKYPKRESNVYKQRFLQPVKISYFCVARFKS